MVCRIGFLIFFLCKFSFFITFLLINTHFYCAIYNEYSNICNINTLLIIQVITIIIAHMRFLYYLY
jgi:phosphatidylglycerophosphate synthase